MGRSQPSNHALNGNVAKKSNTLRYLLLKSRDTHVLKRSHIFHQIISLYRFHLYRRTCTWPSYSVTMNFFFYTLEKLIFFKICIDIMIYYDFKSIIISKPSSFLDTINLQIQIDFYILFL